MKALLLTLVIPFLSFSRTLEEQIRFNKPNLSSSYVVKLAKSFRSAADKYKVPANVLASIAMVESSYRLDAVNSKSDDYGIMQINKFNIKAYGFDKQRLLSDLDYSIDCGAKVFKWFYKTYREIDVVVRRYNCGVSKNCINWNGPKKYWKKVLTHM